MNPKTWLSGKGSAPSGPPPADSFDPKSWSLGPKAAGTGVRTGAGGRTPPPPLGRREVLLGAGLVVLAGTGALAVGVLRKPRKAAAQVRAVPPPAGLKEASYEAQDIAGLGGLRTRLLNYGVPAGEADAAVAALAAAAGRDPGPMHLTLRLGRTQARPPRLTWLETRRVADGAGFQLTREGDGFAVARVSAQLSPHLVPHLRLQINRDGLYASAVGDLDPGLMNDFAQALAFDFDISAEVREGDQFEVVHEEMRDARGDVVGRPKLLFAFLSAGGKDRYLYRFKPPGGEEGWFDDRGRTNKRAFMRTPLDGARVTSLFGLRVHPVFHTERMHKGIDFGCRIGTHVFAAADGVVTYAGPATGFGVLLKVSHAGGLETWYGHLSGFPEDIVVGAKVAQGKLVAFSGNVGFSTGPHLHYETHKDGVAIDPKQFLDAQDALPGAQSVGLSGADLTAFLAFKDRIDEVRRSEA